MKVLRNSSTASLKCGEHFIVRFAARDIFRRARTSVREASSQGEVLEVADHTVTESGALICSETRKIINELLKIQGEQY